MLNEKKIKKIIKNYSLQHREDVLEFINKNPESLDVNELSRIAELVNNSRSDTAAYYTDSTI
ncbi:DNA methyltransferase, partial [Enterococcus cecorum]|nr:DNA methyltransferase [Enterococcus cecorum]